MWISLRNPRPTKKLALSVDAGSELLDLSLTIDGNTAAVLTTNGQVIIYDLILGQELTSLVDDMRRVTSVVLLGAQQVITGAESGSITFWSLSKGLDPIRGTSLNLHSQQKKPLEASALGGSSDGREPSRTQVHRMAASRNRRWLLTAGSLTARGGTFWFPLRTECRGSP